VNRPRTKSSITKRTLTESDIVTHRRRARISLGRAALDRVLHRAVERRTEVLDLPRRWALEDLDHAAE
jgi:hypothetical protein